MTGIHRILSWKMLLKTKGEPVPRTGSPYRLLGPCPVADLILVYTFSMGIVQALDDLHLEPFLDMSPGRLKTRHAIDDIKTEVEAIDLIDDG